MKRRDKGCLLALLACVAFWLMLGVIMTAHAAEPQAVDKPTMMGIRHLAGVDPDLVLRLPEETEPELVSLGEFTVTAYCACERCCGKAPSDPLYGITATGTVATEGRTIATDPTVLPYGTVVYVNGHAYTVEDCGGGVKGRQIDLYFDSHDEAKEWGVQTREVWTIGR